MSRIEENEICNLVMTVEGVKGCHKIRTRGSRGDIKIDMHLLVQSDMPLEDAHLILLSAGRHKEFEDFS